MVIGPGLTVSALPGPRRGCATQQQTTQQTTPQLRQLRGRGQHHAGVAVSDRCSVATCVHLSLRSAGSFPWSRGLASACSSGWHGLVLRPRCSVARPVCCVLAAARCDLCAGAGCGSGPCCFSDRGSGASTLPRAKPLPTSSGHATTDDTQMQCCARLDRRHQAWATEGWEKQGWREKARTKRQDRLCRRSCQ